MGYVSLFPFISVRGVFGFANVRLQISNEFIMQQVFDGHGGTDAATYVRQNILKFILEDSQFPGCLENAIQNAFVKADHAFADNTSLDISSGTTALTALVFGRYVKLFVVLGFISYLRSWG